jgi:O-antigen/teichoic acid export membrane protein
MHDNGCEQPSPSTVQDNRDEPLAYRAVRGGIWAAAGAYWGIGFGFFANILLTRMLSPTFYGEFALAIFFYTLLQLRPKVGLGIAFAQQPTINGKSIGTYFFLDIALGIGGLALTVAAAPVLLWHGYSPSVVYIMLVLAVLSVLEACFGVFSALLEQRLHFKPGSLIGSVALPISYLPAFWLAMNGHGGLSLIAQVITFTLLSFSLHAVYIWRKMRDILTLSWRFDRELATTYLRFGVLSGVSNSTSALSQQMDTFLIGTFAGTASLGYYDRAYRMMQWPSLLLNAVLSRSALFTYARLKDDRLRRQRALNMLIWISISVTMPVTLTLLLAAPDIVTALYGEHWQPAVSIVRILFIAGILRPLWDNLSVLFIGAGHPRRALVVNLTQMVGVLLLGSLLGSLFSIEGVALAVGLSYLISLAVVIHRFGDEVDIQYWRQLGAPLAAAALTTLLYLAVVRLAPFADLPLSLRVIGKTVFVIVGYFMIILALQPALTREHIRYLYKLLRPKVASTTDAEIFVNAQGSNEHR